MSVKANQEAVRKAMVEAGTYREEFEAAIKTLAQMMEDCAKVEKEFKKSKGEYITTYTNKAGAENLVKNPYYGLIESLRRDMLSYYSALGLTPAGLKKINARMKGKSAKGSGLEAKIKELKHLER